MFLLGLSSAFIPYLLLTLATLICYLHDHRETSVEAETTISATIGDASEIFAATELHQQSHLTIKLVQYNERPPLFKEISARIFTYTGLPQTSISSHHHLRAPPRFSIIYY